MNLIYSAVLLVLFNVVTKLNASSLEQSAGPDPYDPDRIEYVTDINSSLSEKERISQAAAANETEEKQGMERKLEERVLSAAQSAVSEIELWGKVVDRNGYPVEGVSIEYSADSGYLAEGSGVGRTVTGPDGSFVISNVKGARLVIRELDKPGYVYNSRNEGGIRFEPRSPSSTFPYWGDYSEQEPFMITMTKVSEFPGRVKGNKMLGFVPDGRTYNIHFLASGALKLQAAESKGDLNVSFSRDSDSWSVELQTSDGGLQETNDLYMISPPESGYETSIKYRFSKKEKDTLKKNFYILLQNGRISGHLTLEIIPYYREKSVIIFDYAIDIDET